MDFIRVQNTPYFYWDFGFKIWFRARQVTGSFEKRSPGGTCYTVLTNLFFISDTVGNLIAFSDGTFSGETADHEEVEMEELPKKTVSIISMIEQFSLECRKTKTKVITLANHKGHRQYS